MPTRQTAAAEVQALVGRAARERDVKGIDEYLALALRDVDRSSPRHVKLTLTGDGTDEYALPSPWERGFSVIERVRWVVGNDFNAVPVWIEDDEYEIEYESDGDAQIRFYYGSPSSSDRVVVEHTARHTLAESAASTTLNDTQTGALTARAASLLLRAAAASVASSVPQGTDEDFVEPAVTNAAGEYRRLADDFDAEYRRLLGITDDAPSTPVIKSVPTTPGRRNYTYATHPRRGAAWRT